MDEATTQLTGTADGAERAWWAIVGVEPTPDAGGVSVTAHDKTRRLATATDLGPITLKPGGAQLIEYRRATPHAVDGWACYQSWPIIVEGHSEADHSVEFDNRAAAKVRRAAALLALAWREPWQVRAAPRSTRGFHPRIPESDRPPLTWFAEPLQVEPMDTLLPDWLYRAWSVVDAEGTVADALMGWHEGLLVEAAHPTLALVAYTAATEAIAQSSWARSLVRFDDASTCRTCGRGGSSKRSALRSMVELVASPEVISLLKPWYGRRSATVHAARHHGTEGALGSIFDLGPRMTAPNPDTQVGDLEVQQFVLELVPAARAVVARLLERCMVEEWPTTAE